MARSSKKDVRRVFLLLLLKHIESGQSLTRIASILGIKKQSLNYHLKKLRALKVLERIQSYPYASYHLTAFGQQVKKILIQSEIPKSLFRCHDLIVGFDIVSFGSFNFVDTSNRKIVSMNNWRYARESQGEFVINVQDTGLVKIYCPEQYNVEPDNAFASMYAKAQSIAQEYCDRYDMKLGNLKVIRKGHKSLVKSEKFAKLLGQVNLGDIWVDESLGTGELEAKQDDYTIESLLKVPKLMEENIIVMREFTKQIELHLEVLNKMSDTLDKINSSMDRK